MQSDIQMASNRRPPTTARVGKALLVLGFVALLLPLVIAGIDWGLMWSRMLPEIQSLSSPTASASAPLPMGYLGGGARWLELEVFAFGPAGSLLILVGAIAMAVARRRLFSTIGPSGPTSAPHL